MAISSTSASPSTNAVAYHNGAVYTIDTTRPRAEGFVVCDGKFTFVGTTAEVLEIARREHMPTYDLNSQFVMPGIHDAHVHLLYAGLASLSHVQPGMDVTNSNIASKLADKGCACEYANAYGDWLVGEIYRIEDYDRNSLDTAFPETPVVLSGCAGHAMFLNTAALKAAGYDAEEESKLPHHHFFTREDDSMTGEVAELAMTKVRLSMPTPPMAHVKRCLRESLRTLTKFGVTSCQEASANTVMLRALQELENEAKLQMDVQTHIVYKPEFLAAERYSTLHPTLDAADQYRSKHVETRYVKLMLDGIPLHPYYTHAGIQEDGTIDEAKIQIDDLEAALVKFDGRGMTCKIHATGQGSVRRSLDVYEKVRDQNPHGPRHEIAHCNAVHDDDYARFKSLRITAEMSPSGFFVHPITESNAFMNWDFPRMIHSGAHLTLGTDAAASGSNLLPTCASIVQTVGAAFEGPDDVHVKGGEAICRMLTLAGAEATGRDDHSGSIEIGKKANFIRVNRDLSKGQFDGATVTGTWFEGEQIWRV